MAQPAARMGDLHVCPQVAPPPHIGLPIVGPCYPKVIIGGQFAARVGDLAACVGPLDPIALGSTKVFIGGQMAARMLDTCEHAENIVMGYPKVLIG